MMGFIPKLSRPENWSLEFITLVDLCLDPDAKQRGSAAECLKVQG
jgi:hypothetical protein